MTESKIEIHDRLRREGRWSEASRFKDTVIKECRARGVKKAEAAEHAWEEMAKAFPPLPATTQPPVLQQTAQQTAQQTFEPAAEAQALEPREPPTPAASRHGHNGHGHNGHGHNGHGTPGVPPVPEEDIDIDALLERVGDSQPPDLARDTLWVYQHLANRKAKPEAAPSLGAWSLLQWARQYRNRFFEQVLPKAMAAHESEEEQEHQEEQKSIAEIERLLDRMEEGVDQELLADVPRAVRDRVRAVLSDWGRRFGVALSDDARKSLEAHLDHLVQEFTAAIAPASGVG